MRADWRPEVKSLMATMTGMARSSLHLPDKLGHADFLKTFKTCQTIGPTERFIMSDRVIFCQTSSCSL